MVNYDIGPEMETEKLPKASNEIDSTGFFDKSNEMFEEIGKNGV